MKIHLPLVLCSCLLLCDVSASAKKGIVDKTTKLGLYHADPHHLWNRLHRALFVRSYGKKGKIYGQDMVDPLLWPNTTEFLLSGPSHEKALTILDEFLDGKGEKLVDDPLKQAVLQHDLWAVFDWTANLDQPRYGSRVGVAVRTEKLDGARLALRKRLAAAIRALAPKPEEIAKLPDNYAAAAASGAYAKDFDPKRPEQLFLPPDLLDPKGSWVCVRGAASGPSAPVHVEYYRGRSPFLVFIRLPGGRAATLDYLKALNTSAARRLKLEDWEKGLAQFPVGTAVALLRQMTVIDRAGRITGTPITQTVQMRVYREVDPEPKEHSESQAMFKYVMARGPLFEGVHGGLQPVGKEKRVGLSLLYGDDYLQANTLAKNRGIMQSCIDCHACGGATVKSVFSFKQDDWVPAARQFAPSSLRLVATTAEIERKRAMQWKTKRHDWGLLQGWLEQRR